MADNPGSYDAFKEGHPELDANDLLQAYEQRLSEYYYEINSPRYPVLSPEMLHVERTHIGHSIEGGAA